MTEYNYNNGYTQLKKLLNGELPNPSTLPYDNEAEFVDSLNALEYVNIEEFDVDIFDNQLRLRSKIRYLSALFPDKNLNELTERIHSLLNNKNLSVEKLRLILSGKKLSDPSQDTHEVRLRIIQGIGKCLNEGMSLRRTAREMGVSFDTVYAIERYTGIHKAYRLRQADRAVYAVRDGLSVRSFAKKENISRTMARTLLNKGRNVLIELGEINE